MGFGLPSLLVFRLTTQWVRSRSSVSISISILPLTVFIIASFVFLLSHSRTACHNSQFLREYYFNSSSLSTNCDSNDSIFFWKSQILLSFFTRSFYNPSNFAESSSKASARESNCLSSLIREIFVSS